jgi:AraC family transcriptional regulator of adaptative response / DNA-3-methyladenine glycosylase II
MTTGTDPTSTSAPAPATGLELDDDARYRAMRTRDPRFDGWFFIGVRTTGIYCRPSCPTPVQPKRSNIDFYPTAAAAQQAGFRACKRCRPDATPGSPAWNLRADLVGRALRSIADGVVDRDGVAGLARHLAVSERHLNRVLGEQVGAGPIALARAQRAQTARVLIETTDLPLGQVAFAAGFSSIRQFNDTVREVFATTPSDLRRAAATRAARSRRTGSRGADGPYAGLTGAITVRLPLRSPFDADHLWAFLGARAVPGVESIDGATYRRSMLLPHGSAVAELTARPDHVRATFHLRDVRDLATATARARRLLDLDADPVAIDGVLADDRVLRPLVRAQPGRRAPGSVDPHELAIRAVLGQQISVGAARTIAARLAAEHGEPIEVAVTDDVAIAIDRTFPTVETLAELDPATLPMPRARARTVVALAAALAQRRIVLGPGADRAGATHALLAIGGIGPWTASYIAMRSLSDPDAFLPTDIAVLKGAANLGLPVDPKALTAHAERWRPWRSYATHLLWSASLDPDPDR